MTNQPELGRERTFVCAILPGLVAFAAFAVYLLTLNRWVSLGGLSFLAKASGQTTTPGVYFPFFSLVTFPLYWLPLKWIPIASNLFSAVCAMLTLLLLARCVALMPQDRTQAQRQREQSEFSLLSLRTNWIPPLLAVFVCGFQLTFWENATAISSNIFDLLLFAYVVRCFLEFRIFQRNSWLLRAAFIFAAGMTDSWVFIGLLPAFIAAVIWMKGREFFNAQFILRILLCGFVGLLFYLTLPLINSFSDGEFWPTLQANWVAQKNVLIYVFHDMPHHVQLLLVLTSLLPLLVIGIRWKTSFGDPSPIGILLTTWTIHIVHVAMFFACVWTAFDPAFSLRKNSAALLPLYFLSAMNAGYFAGYFLLVLVPTVVRGRRPLPFENFLHKVFTTVVVVLLIAIPAGLIYKNLPQIEATNGPGLKQYAALMAQGLPARGIVLSDEPLQLLLTETFLSRDGRANNFLFLHTASLKHTLYHRMQQKRHPNLWPVTDIDTSQDREVPDLKLLDFMAKASESNSVFYLHPSFGYYFEYFYAVPHGLVCELKRYATNTAIAPPPLSEAVLNENETFWNQITADVLKPLEPQINPPESEVDLTFRQKFMERLHIPFEPNAVAVTLGRLYSHSLNFWGVQAQRNNQLDAASQAFAEAHALNPENVVAEINLNFNGNLRTGKSEPAKLEKSVEDRFGAYRSWQDLLRDNGPFDEPSFCLSKGRIFLQGHLLRQAATDLSRVLELNPENLPARLSLASVYLGSQAPENALPLLDYLDAHTNSFAEAQINPLEVFQTELMADYVNKRTNHAQEIIQTLLRRNPPDTNALNIVAQVCSAYHDYTNALRAVTQELETAPDNLSALINKGSIYLQLGDYDHARPALDSALTMNSTNYFALINRALLFLRTGDLDSAQRDYQAISNSYPRAFPAYFGLGEIASRKHDTNAAIHYYELYLTNSPPNNPENKVVRERLDSLKAEPH